MPEPCATAIQLTKQWPECLPSQSPRHDKVIDLKKIDSLYCEWQAKMWISDLASFAVCLNLLAKVNKTTQNDAD